MQQQDMKKRTARKKMQIESLSQKSENLIRKCMDCGETMVGSPQSYQYIECGLSSVEIRNVTVYNCGSCGACIPELPAIEQLHMVIAIQLLIKDSLLSGEEIRFLRKMAGLTQSELAEILGMTPTRPCKWESGREPIGDANDRALRSFCLFGMSQRVFTGEDPMHFLKSAADFIRQIDVKEVFRNIESLSSGPKAVKVESSGNTPEPWKLPSNCQERHVN